ncbi:hypothetical protein BDZ97DRAFT_1912253 [Flammula alnicola]|nr:hypothetical protein BDZ97DRAFT_1912253 [Flammula alnicola]
MALSTDVFEPRTIRGILKGLEKSATAKEQFEIAWKANVNKRVNSWTNHKDNCTPAEQLEWEAEVVEYVDYLHSKLAVHGNASTSAKEIPRIIDKSIPLLGPRTSFGIRWDGWNSTGARNVYGIRMNERAIGYQLRCKDCKANDSPGGYCFVATNHVFWDKWEHWKIPRNIPYFLKRAAVTHELFDLIVELRPSSTSAGLAENLKQLHLLEYRQRMLEYLSYFKSARPSLFKRNNLQKFSSPTDEKGYNDCFLTNDLVTDLYLDFIARVRQSESVEYSKTRTAKSISLDNTFKSAGKATIIDKDGYRQNPLKGGILSAINEEGEGLSWRFCVSPSPAERSGTYHLYDKS